MKIIFSCLGFATADAFIVKDGRQFMVGTISNMGIEKNDYWPYEFFTGHYLARGLYGLTEADKPCKEQVIAEYERQLAEKGISINNEIVYAG
jgi:hypothetical protein